MKRQLILGVAFVALLGGCVGKAPGYVSEKSIWIGSDQRAIMAKWGKPTRSFTTADGVLVLVYNQTDWESEGGGGVPGEAIPLDCSTAFSLKDGRVFGVKTKGSGCS